MKTTAGLALLLAALPAALADLTVNTPNSVTECEPAQLTWNEGTPPYYVSLIPAGQPTAAPMKQWPPQDGTTMTWNPVDLPANTNFNVALKDSTGKQVFSALVTVQAGGTTCDKEKAAANLANASTAAPAQSAGAGGDSGKLTLAASSTASGGSTTATHASSSSGTGTGTHTSSTSSESARASGSTNSNAASPGAGPLTTASGLMLAAAFGLVKLGAMIF